MSLISKPNTFVNGQTADASLVNADLDTIYADYNGNITDANLANSGITSAGKVSGTALTGLASIPSGAGVIPIANLATGTPTGSKFIRDDGTLQVAGLATSFVDRGDPAALDFTTSSFTKDSAWHDLDLSSIVPAGAKAVVCRCLINNTGAGVGFRLRKKGNSNAINYSENAATAAGGYNSEDMVVIVDSNRFIQYWVANSGTYTVLDFVVRGWWL